MHKIVDENYFDQIINNILIPYFDFGDNVTTLNEKHSIAFIPSNNFDYCDLGKYPYHRFPSIFTMESELIPDTTGATSIRPQNTLGLMGQGVLVGVLDSGVDYTHSAFRYPDGTTKILAIWDQTIQEGTPPEGFVYGKVYTREEINLALQASDPYTLVPSRDMVGHGTALASVIVGTANNEQGFYGVVPNADLVVVKLKPPKENLRKISMIKEDVVCYQETDVIMGIRYLTWVAEQLKRPIVICLALGTSQGGHDGQGATSKYISTLSTYSHIGIVTSAGNEGNRRRHYFNTITIEEKTKTFELNVAEQDRRFYMEIWPEISGRLGITIITPNGESTKIIYPQIGKCISFNFILDQSTIYVSNNIFEEETGSQMILIRFENPTVGIWRLEASNLENEKVSFHAWLPADNLLSEETYFLNANPDVTITSPGNASNSTTTTAYNERNNSIIIQSSRGYTRSDLVKPDFAAPGYRLLCATANNSYGALSATGAAAAYTTGIMAMIMEWAVVRGNYYSVSGDTIRHQLIRGAKRNAQDEYPNKVWGYGMIDLQGFFNQLII